ncbi:uncharacterized protein BP5553_09758 [Venustampulla echinocandica]|uniref:Uncharacterized protein n=1 Tax=Venustampulla echinocandica TaxID=2656787 RepID=A0A370TBX8_9HELO|nr:uncharacterized protein BP5553_09758 [Venustampulla echinocandica]RDL31549.1 hypothetical protein BP5553_09758 [Venustampulla echinocandica]
MNCGITKTVEVSVTETSSDQSRATGNYWCIIHDLNSQPPTVLERISTLVEAQLHNTAANSKDDNSVAHELGDVEVRSSRADATVIGPPDVWEPEPFQDSEVSSNLASETSSDAASETSSGEVSETSSDEASEAEGSVV